MAKKRFTTLANLDEAIVEITNDYRNAVLGAIGDGIEECANIFIKEASAASPEDTGEYKDSWVIKPMSRTKFVKYIGNAKKVKGKDRSGKPARIPLINILEFTKRVNKDGQPVARPVVRKALRRSKEPIISVIISKIQKGGENA